MSPAGVHVVAIRRDEAEIDRVVVTTARVGEPWLRLADVVICPDQPSLLRARRCAREMMNPLPGCRVAVVRHGSDFLVRSSSGEEVHGPWHIAVLVLLTCLGLEPANRQAVGSVLSWSRN